MLLLVPVLALIVIADVVSFRKRGRSVVLATLHEPRSLIVGLVAMLIIGGGNALVAENFRMTPFAILAGVVVALMATMVRLSTRRAGDHSQNPS